MSGDVARRIIALEGRVLRLERLNDSLVGEVARLQQGRPVIEFEPVEMTDAEMARPGLPMVRVKPAKAEKPAG